MLGLSKQILLSVSVVVLSLTGLPAQEAEETEDIHGLRSPYTSEQLVNMAHEARQKGFQYLIETQNPDGSWGSHDPTIPYLKDFGFSMLNLGAQQALTAACTALCAQAYLEMDELTPPQEESFQKAVDFLLRGEKIAFKPGESFNIWGYAYKLDFLGRLLENRRGEGFHEEIKKAAQVCIEGLMKYQLHEGGWGYYASQMHNFESMSFTTAVIVSALNRVRRLGLDVPQAVVNDGAQIVLRQRAGDGSFIYSSSHVGSGGSALMNLGAGSRTVCCALALYETKNYKNEDLELSMRIFDNGENYLESGRKLIQPHAAVHAISGYFFFFGYYYAAEIGMLLEDKVPVSRWNRLGWTMLRTQEENGMWWDTPAASYGDKWGTAFAILTLNRFLAAMQPANLATPFPPGIVRRVKF